MKCIARRSASVDVTFYLLLFVLIIPFILFFTEQDKDIKMIYLIPIFICIGMAIWQGYNLFKTPSEIVFYDEYNSKIIVYLSKNNKREIKLSDISHISLDRPIMSRATWYEFVITLKDGEEITLSKISYDNEILESLTQIKNNK